MTAFVQVIAKFILSLAGSLARMFFFRKAFERSFGARQRAPKPARVVDVEPAERQKGLDYLLGVTAASAEAPLVRAFREMISAEEGRAATAPGFRETGRRDLAEHELVALAIVTSAAQTAAARRDVAGLKETLQLGLSCALRFDDYLESKRKLRVEPERLDLPGTTGTGR